MTAADILRSLEQLALDEALYVVHSSASLVLRGVLETAGDVDIVAHGSAWRRAEEMVRDGAASLDRGTHDQRVSLGSDVEIYDGWLGESGEAVVSRAEIVQGVPCAPLQDVIAMKLRLDRPKDRRHLELICAHQAAHG